MIRREKREQAIPLILLLVSLLISSCSPSPKKLIAKPYTAVYDVASPRRGVLSAVRMSDGNGKFRTEINKDDGKVEIKILDASGLKVTTLYPDSKVYVERDMEEHEADISESFDGVAFDSPKAPIWKYLSSGKVGNYKTQLWRQDQGGGNFTRTVNMQFGEDIGCPVSLQFFESDTPQETVTYTLKELNSAKPEASNFIPPNDYQKK
ncbi:MAG: hypothetical protein K2X81_02590 [Candidatus Obscuribacterales bacterium]|nr:hypothetical protein [Candidatus Obscuribacterales bacterium]